MRNNEYLHIIFNKKLNAQDLWFRNVLEDIGETQNQATIIFCNNISATKLAKNPIHKNKSNNYILEVSFHKRYDVEAYC